MLNADNQQEKSVKTWLPPDSSCTVPTRNVEDFPQLVENRRFIFFCIVALPANRIGSLHFSTFFSFIEYEKETFYYRQAAFLQGSCFAVDYHSGIGNRPCLAAHDYFNAPLRDALIRQTAIAKINQCWHRVAA